jgi:hypothetical protein
MPARLIRDYSQRKPWAITPSSAPNPPSMIPSSQRKSPRYAVSTRSKRRSIVSNRAEVRVTRLSSRRSMRSRLVTVLRAICSRMATRLSMSAGYRPPEAGSSGVSSIRILPSACGIHARRQFARGIHARRQMNSSLTGWHPVAGSVVPRIGTSPCQGAAYASVRPRSGFVEDDEMWVAGPTQGGPRLARVTAPAATGR